MISILILRNIKLKSKYFPAEVKIFILQENLLEPDNGRLNYF